MTKSDMTLLKKCIKKHLICRIERAMIDQRPMFCVPFEMSENLLAVHFVDDFLYNGIKVIRIEDITKVKLNEPEKLLQTVFNDLCIPLPELDGKLELENFCTLFEGVDGLLVAVECEKRGMKKFMLGIFGGSDDVFVQIHCVNSSGKWDDFYSCVLLSEITCVTLVSRYQRIFSEYVQ